MVKFKLDDLKGFLEIKRIAWDGTGLGGLPVTDQNLADFLCQRRRINTIGCEVAHDKFIIYDANGNVVKDWSEDWKFHLQHRRELEKYFDPANRARVVELYYDTVHRRESAERRKENMKAKSSNLDDNLGTDPLSVD